ncbi:MAG TPA: CBS domain-containing protein [Microvirga sp.]|jgi:CBS-domain-containing membrane protein|nr:CBS domain-containing protein [Microvirga sp.]
MTDLKAGHELTAADVMVAQVVTVAPDATLQEAARVLLEHRISGLPVVDEAGRLVGVISEGDLLRRTEIGTERRRSWWLEMMVSQAVKTEEFVRSHATRVADLMTADVVAAAEETPLHEIASLLERHGIKRVPILREGRLVGLVSRANLLQAFAAAAAAQRAPETVRDDRSLREAVIRRLKQVPGGMPWLVTVTVEAGVVELRGPVTSPEQRQALRVAAETTPGVRAVDDGLFKHRRAAE